jgi:uncharacterized Zn-finger protein
VDVTCELCELCKVRRLVLACAGLTAAASCSHPKIYINSNLRSDKILDPVDLPLGG